MREGLRLLLNQVSLDSKKEVSQTVLGDPIRTLAGWGYSLQAIQGRTHRLTIVQSLAFKGGRCVKSYGVNAYVVHAGDMNTTT